MVRAALTNEPDQLDAALREHARAIAELVAIAPEPRGPLLARVALAVFGELGRIDADARDALGGGLSRRGL